MALGIGRVVPELGAISARWPYDLAGVGFALWGIAAIGYGTVQRARVAKALGEGRFVEPAPWPLRALTLTGLALGLLTALLILFD